MLGVFFWRGWLVLIFTIVLIKFFHKTFVCKSMKQLFFTKWNNVNNIKKNVKRKLYQGSFCSLSTAHM